MKTFQEWREGGKVNSEVPIIKKIAGIFQHMESLETEISNLLNQMSKNHGPVNMALEKFQSSFNILQSTLKVAIEKHSENPERSDHPPHSIQSS